MITHSAQIENSRNNQYLNSLENLKDILKNDMFKYTKTIVRIYPANNLIFIN